MTVKRSHITALRSYLVGDKPNDSGEWSMHCPLHDDSTRSASLNVNTGQWFCHACAQGGAVRSLVKELGDTTESTPEMDSPFEFEPGEESGKIPLLESEVRSWAKALRKSKKKRMALQRRKGISRETIKDYEIGWDEAQGAYTIPIRDADGVLVNIRRYDLNPAPDRRKIWSVTGYGNPDLYPIDQLENDELVFCEGEWDALLTIQNGQPAITRTGSAKTWQKSWGPLFEGKSVFVTQDMDKDGQIGNNLVVTSLKPYAETSFPVLLPYEVTEKHGKDLSDYWLDGHDLNDLHELIEKAADEEEEDELVETAAKIQDSFRPENHGERLRMRVTIAGKSTAPYLVPREVELSCDQSAGKRCANCTLHGMDGQMDLLIDEHDPVILKAMTSTEEQLVDILRKRAQVEKCPRLKIETKTMNSSAYYTIRPSVDSVEDDDSEEYVARRVVVVNDDSTQVNTTVDMVGHLYPDPRQQTNELLVDQVIPVETSIDRFDLTPDVLDQLQLFKPDKGQRPIAKAGEIAQTLSETVTRIYNRKEMHVFMDLVFHSVIAWHFNGNRVSRGWLEGVVLGDTRTGKSEAAEKLIRYYRTGAMVSCEAASFAGVVGGLQQIGGKHWEITWGVIPLNDRRLVVLDEVSGLETEQIAQMSSIRSSGIAELTKIRTEKTRARTRLLWLGNPRGGTRMADHTHGINALRPLIGNNEDIARFDFAMAVTSAEVSAEEINVLDHGVDNPYTSDACHNLVKWAWSRTPEQVIWGTGVEAFVLQQALALGRQYVEDPPLIQAANVRMKIARLAVALAARTFSHVPEEPELLLVTKQHVKDVVWFLNRIYSLGNFGYKEFSEEVLEDENRSRNNRKPMIKMLNDNPELEKFLKTCYGNFRTNDISETLGMERAYVAELMGDMYRYGMIRRQGAHIKLMPTLHNILRERA